MGPLTRIVGILFLWAAASFAWADAQVEGVRIWPAPDHTRLVLDLSGPVEHTVFSLANPERLVIDIDEARLLANIDFDYSETLLKGIRTGIRDKTGLRVVLDLKSRVRPKTFLLRPNGDYGHRLVIDLEDTARRTPPKAPDPRPDVARSVIVAIDAGHGGDDPGAIGPGRTYEKDVVLAIARRLRSLVEKEYGMQAVMIRDGDYFIGLDRRAQIAREHRADLFVSIHADAFRDPRVGGASVYALSQRGASSEHARLLAEKENASDLVGGVSLDDKDDLLRSVLLDLSQTATIEASMNLGAVVLTQLDGVAKLHKRKVEQAAFRVLKSPDIPSILVEAGFISNPKEERVLRSAKHQQQIAEAIMAGIRGHFRSNPPRGTLLTAVSERQHVIARGDTLSGLAQQYRVSAERLRDINRLEGNVLKVGDTLTIPGVTDG